MCVDLDIKYYITKKYVSSKTVWTAHAATVSHIDGLKLDSKAGMADVHVRLSNDASNYKSGNGHCR